MKAGEIFSLAITFVNASTAAQISQLAKRLRTEHELGDRWLAADRFHVSLYSLGTRAGVPDIVVHAASMAAEAVAASTPAFKVNFGRVDSFTGSPDNRPFVLRDRGDNVALMEFHRRLGAELGKYGFPYDGNSRFTPHLTLLYSQRSVAEASINPVSWMVNEFFLVHSLLGKTRYRRLAHWPLQG